MTSTRAAGVDLDFRAGSTFPVPICTVPSSMNRTSQCNKVDAVRLDASYMLNLLLLKNQRCVSIQILSCFAYIYLFDFYNAIFAQRLRQGIVIIKVFFKIINIDIGFIFEQTQSF